MGSFQDLSGQKFGRLTAIKVVDKLSHTYLFKIHRTEQEKKSEIKAHYILC